MNLDTRPFLCSITRLDCNPEKAIPWHWHRLFEINYIRKGELYLETPEKKSLLHTGDANFINYGSLHTCRAVGDTPCEYYTLHFDMHFLSGIYNSILEDKYFLPVIRNTALQFWQVRPDSLSHLKMIEYGPGPSGPGGSVPSPCRPAAGSPGRFSGYPPSGPGCSCR